MFGTDKNCLLVKYTLQKKTHKKPDSFTGSKTDKKCRLKDKSSAYKLIKWTKQKP